MENVIKESSKYEKQEKKERIMPPSESKFVLTSSLKTSKKIEFEAGSDPISHVEKEYPQMTAEFKKIQDEQYKLFCRKQHDYGPGNISVGTQLQTKEEIHLSLTGLWFRMNDKIQRLKNMLMSGRQSAVNEPLEDTYLDVSNYGVMAMIVKSGKWGK
jgi:hypothetical protein